MAAASVRLVQKNQHLCNHLLGSQKYDPEGGLGRKFPRITGASVLFIGPYLSPDLLLFLVWMQGLTWQWDQGHTRGKSLGVSCTWVPVQAPISMGGYHSSVRPPGTAPSGSLSCRHAAGVPHAAGTAGVSTCHTPAPPLPCRPPHGTYHGDSCMWFPSLSITSAEGNCCNPHILSPNYPYRTSCML